MRRILAKISGVAQKHATAFGQRTRFVSGVPPEDRRARGVGARRTT